jgi:hypothetical protein
MSTICKLDPMVRVRRHARAGLLRNPPRAHRDHALHGAILAELRLIQLSSRLTGAAKHALFHRGANQLRTA